jgi:hypothetical protein
LSSTALSISTFPEIVSVDQVATEYLPAATGYGDTEPAMWDIAIKIKTHTPGAGTLLATVTYHDGEGFQDLNTALGLTAGNYSLVSWPCVLRDPSHPVSVAYTFLSPGGEGEVSIFLRYS